MNQIFLEFNLAPDAYGFIYGQAIRGQRYFNINLLPPKAEWQGQFELEGVVPDERDWVAYVDGEEAARAATRAATEDALKRTLAER